MTCIPGGDEYEWGGGSRASLSAESERRLIQSRRADDRIMQQAHAFVASMEIIGDGVILLDNEAWVIFASGSAHSILHSQEAPVQIVGDRLQFDDPKNERLLKVLLAQNNDNEKTAPNDRLLVIERVPPHQPLLLSLIPLPPAEPDEHSAPRMMVIFRDPDNVPAPQWQIFARHFQLSATEIRFCLALADGLTVAEYSEKYHISPHTARTHLKSVFAKTSTRRQADLLRLIFAFTRL